MKQTMHDGSRSYSIEVPNPQPGEGKHAKTLLQIIRRHAANQTLEGARRIKKIIERG